MGTTKSRSSADKLCGLVHRCEKRNIHNQLKRLRRRALRNPHTRRVRVAQPKRAKIERLRNAALALLIELGNAFVYAEFALITK